LSSGACRCGEVRLRVDGAPLATFACHCTGCQRMSGSAFSLSSLYPLDRFEITQGETVLGGMKADVHHHHCPSCMSWLYTVGEAMPGLVNVRSSMLDDAGAHRPFVDAWLREALPWVSSGAERSFEQLPANDDVPELLQAYAQWDGRVKQ
jgi:hypothetical protein